MLTIEEKYWWLPFMLRLEELMRVKQEERRERERQEEVEREKQRRKQGQELQQVRQKLQDDKMKQLAEQRRREKMEDRMAKYCKYWIMDCAKDLYSAAFLFSFGVWSFSGRESKRRLHVTEKRGHSRYLLLDFSKKKKNFLLTWPVRCSWLTVFAQFNHMDILGLSVLFPDNRVYLLLCMWQISWLGSSCFSHNIICRGILKLLDVSLTSFGEIMHTMWVAF